MPNSGRKGSRFERGICRVLTDWWVGTETEDCVFWRTAGSGGRATRRGKAGKKTNRAHCGDIAALTEDAALLTRMVTFELKSGYNHATLHDLLDRSAGAAKQTYEKWIQQARASADAAGTQHWAVIHQRTRRTTMLVANSGFFSATCADPPGRGFMTVSTLRCSGYSVCSVPLVDFLREVDPDQVRNYVELFDKKAKKA